ncbi:sirohydrochlorin cobaltochelatase [Anaerococcus sp. AGMB00486]|uniref:Sirohydrochlorin cobaltochelatase n=2 Tax=Anaerococcus TaxID=165779 RepID=A0ABX2NBT5_9FIRM|nr:MULTISPECIES: sirohydrochlorin cobaltochelatase [Anaerococcus]MDY3006607.1 sirohydrochlorin cobaltochelatase [Anaerococcus porci]MSS78077.1 cobalt chelatase [Anaerococcus porci]NVF12120.1 sirohydrochlorin cobaltochelatase [Anaerococcus faecalis]
MDFATIIVNHGTSRLNLQYELIERVSRKIKKTYPKSYIGAYLAGNSIRKKIKDKDLKIELEDILKNLREKNIREVKFLMLYVVRGIEYEKLIKLAHSLNKDEFFTFTFTKALLEEDFCDKKILKLIEEISENKESLIIAHGSPKKDLNQFENFKKKIDNQSDKLYFSTFEDNNKDYLISEFKKKDIKKIRIIPFLILAGNHVYRDIESEDKASYKSILKENAISVEIIKKGLIEYDEILNIIVEKLS